MRSIIISATILVLLTFAKAQETQQDTAKVYPMKEIVVTATRGPISIKDSPSPVEVLTREDIFRLNGNSLSDVIRSCAGVQLNDQGSYAALKTLSVRGTSSSQLLVLVDGTRYNSFQNNLVDFSLIPLNNVERIEIVRGGSSALYGADALGGVVHIFTRRIASPFAARTEFSTGSFNYQKYLAEGGGKFSDAGVLVGYSNEKGRDNFLFTYHRPGSSDTVLERSNNDFVRRQLYVTSNISFNPRSELMFSLQNIEVNRGTPGPFFGIGTISEARQDDNDVNVLTNYFNRQLDKFEFDVKGNFHYSLQRYRDPNPFYPIDVYYRNGFFGLTPQLTMLIDSSNRFIIMGEFAQGLLASNDFDNDITRVQKSYSLSYETQYTFERPYFDKISLYATLRYDNISDVGLNSTPKLGINIRAIQMHDIRFHASVGKNFRSPTFNDLYYRGFSNPHLKPEYSTSVDGGISSDIIVAGKHFFDATYFYLDTDNRILFDPTLFVPVNIGRAISEGVELQYKGSLFNEFLQLRVNYTLTNALKKNKDFQDDTTYDKQLPFVPNHLMNVAISLHYEPVVITIAHSIVGQRFTNQNNSQSLPAYRLTNLTGLSNVAFGGWKSFVKVELNNVFGEKYEIFPLYPMPERNVRLTVGIEY